jgi:SAM-dependent methyltransferase
MTSRTRPSIGRRPRNATPRPSAKVYDRGYFDRWYRDSRHALFHLGMLPRRVQLAISAAEYLLERPIRTVLDVGCGEGRWRALLLQARPGIEYLGIDSSEYVVRRYGKRRNIRHGEFGNLGRLGIRGRFDLIVCSDVLHYVSHAEVRSGLKTIARLLAGVAFMELFTADDDTVGDEAEYQPRSHAAYLRLFRQSGLIHLGLHCYAGRSLRSRLVSFERGAGPSVV